MADSSTTIAQLLNIIAQSKLFSELDEQTVISDDSFFASVNTGNEDAKKIKLPLLRGFNGDWNASTNTPILANGTGLAGSIYSVSVAGTRDLGNGVSTYEVEDLVYYNGAKWINLSATANNASDVTIDTDNLKVVVESNLQDYIDGNDVALLKARGTEVLGGTGAVTFTIGAIPAVFDVAPVIGQIKDSTGYYTIDFLGQTNIPVINTGVSSIWVYIDNNNTVQQQITEPTRSEFREKLFLTRLALVNGVIAAQGQECNPSGQYTNMLRDYLSYIKNPKKGLGLSPNANLTFQVASGSIFTLGAMNANDEDNPNGISFSLQNPATFFFVNRSVIISSGLTSVDVTEYDFNGVQTPLVNNRFKILTVHKFNSGNHVIQDGQNQYSTIEEAVLAISTRDFVVNPILEQGTRLGWIIVQEGATDLTDTLTASFKNDTGEIGASTGGSIGVVVAADVGYVNNGFTNVQEALDSLLYVTPLINTFTVTPDVVEIGIVVSAIDFNWSLNKVFTTLSIDNGIGSITPTSLTTLNVTGLNITTTTTFTLTGSDGTNTVNKSDTLNFYYKQFFGTSGTAVTNSAEVRALTNDNFANVNTFVITIDATRYVIAIPATKTLTSVITQSLDNITDSFVLATFNVNDAGATPVSYNVYTYESVVPLNLTATVIVS